MDICFDMLLLGNMGQYTPFTEILMGKSPLQVYVLQMDTVPQMDKMIKVVTIGL